MRGEKTLAESARRHDVHPNLINQRRAKLLEGAADGFGAEPSVSITLDADFCIEALEEALARFGRPKIFSTDQGSRFTSADFTGVLKREEIAIGMGGRGYRPDNVFVERLWRSVKYEEVNLRGGSVCLNSPAS